MRQRGFYNSTLKPLMDKAEDGGEVLLFLDASHFVMGCDYLGFIYGKVRRFVKSFSGRMRYNVLGAALHEFVYIRHGTISLITFLRVADSRIQSPYLNSTRNEEDFCNAVRQLISEDADKNYIIICDGLNTHKSEGLVKLVAQKCSITVDLGIKGKKDILESMKSRETFLMDESHRIRFVYTPKHSSWVNQIEIWFGIINRKLLKKGSYKSVEELAQSILNFP